MKTRLGLVLLVAAAVGSMTDTALAGQHITRLAMGFDIGNGIAPPAGPSRVRVPPGETVILAVLGNSSGTFQWTKDGHAIPDATNQAFTISSVTGADAGLYSLSGVPFPIVATGIDLDVVVEGHLANTSSRVELVAKRPHILGFVVSGKVSKKLLFRAVGPTLKNFGIPNPAPKPQVHCFDSAGHEVTFAVGAVVIDVNALFASVGAFPVTTDELKTISYAYGPFPPGAYTLQVTDDIGGTAMVEVYEFGDDVVIKPAL